MAPDIAGTMFEFFLQYGVFALLVALTLDSAMLLPVFPGELVMVILATQYATDLPSLAFLAVVATLAGTAGSLLLYGIARGAGRPFFEKHPGVFFMSPRTRDRMERLFQRPLGQSLVLILRLFPFVRLLVNIPAGLAKMPVVRFLVLTLIGNLIFHAGFMYVAYESQDPESPVAAGTQAFQESYGNPAVTFFQANALLVAAVVIALGLVLSIRAAVRARRNPEEPFSGSTLGMLSTTTLFWGGAALLAGLWVDPVLVYDTIEASGFDVRDLNLGLPYEPLSLLGAVGLGAMLVASWVRDLRKSAKRRVKETRRRRESAPMDDPREGTWAAVDPPRAQEPEGAEADRAEEPRDSTWRETHHVHPRE